MTNEQWVQVQQSDDEDDASLDYPPAPGYEQPSGANTDYHVEDDPYNEPDTDGDVSGNGHRYTEYGREEPGSGEDGFDDYADPVEDTDDYVDDDEDDYDEDEGELTASPHGLAEPPTGAPGHGPDDAPKPRRFDGKVAMGFAAAGLVAVLVAIVGAVVLYGSDDPAPVTAASPADPAAAPPPTRTAEPSPAAVAKADRPIPYTADAGGSCAPGSTSAQTMAGADPHTAFVCVRGGGDGQVIDIELPGTYLITALAFEPGWVGRDASGAKPWEQYRVVTTVQWMFNDTNRTMITQNTKNVHGEAVEPVKRVLASKVRMLIRETSRPPTQPQDGEPAVPKPGGLSFELPQVPGLGTGRPESDPVDAAFAIKNLKIIGHEPL